MHVCMIRFIGFCVLPFALSNYDPFISFSLLRSALSRFRRPEDGTTGISVRLRKHLFHMCSMATTNGWQLLLGRWVATQTIERLRSSAASDGTLRTEGLTPEHPVHSTLALRWSVAIRPRSIRVVRDTAWDGCDPVRRPPRILLFGPRVPSSSKSSSSSLAVPPVFRSAPISLSSHSCGGGCGRRRPLGEKDGSRREGGETTRSGWNSVVFLPTLTPNFKREQWAEQTGPKPGMHSIHLEIHRKHG